MTKRQKLLFGGLVLVDNDRFEQVSILVREGVIEALIPQGEGPDDAEQIDVSNRLIIPGLVNGHTHSHGALGRGGVAGDLTLEPFLSRAAWLNGSRRVDDLRLAAELSAAESIRKGCTSCFDLFIELPGPTVEGIHAVANAYHEAGLRAVVAPMIADQTLYQALPGLLDSFEPPLRDMVAALSLPDWPKTMATCAEAFDSWPIAMDRVRPGLGPTIPLHCSDVFLQSCSAMSNRDQIPLQTHLAETRMQQVMAMQKYGTTITAHLNNIGVLGPQFSGAHGVWISEPEAAILAGHKSCICHNPLSNLRLGSGIAPVRMLMDAGVGMGVGTDASNTSDGQNMFEAMRLAATLSRANAEGSDEWVSTREAFNMATTGSARIMGLKNVGMIAAGWAADLLFLDAGYCHYTPLRNPLDQIVFSENGAALREVMIAGEYVFANDRVLTLNEAALAVRAHDAVERLDTANAQTRLLNEAASVVVQSFCRATCAASLSRIN
ncbi:amidohydrolase family protein [Falsihalocynthiibacter sp. SS001]|uniref:amidohydrolase family protein n=1 Tax=Falsihalocynthiibacter sp. SS001 TaxID=3349698 RepID=UPI0036D2368A